MATGSAKQTMPSMTVMAAMMLPSVVTGVSLAAADLGQHRGGPPDGLRHIAEPVGLGGTFHDIHGGGRREQHAREDDDAGEQRAPLGGDQAAERCQRRRVARELQEAHQPCQQHELVARKEQLQQQRQQGQRVDQHHRRRCKAQAGAGRRATTAAEGARARSRCARRTRWRTPARTAGRRPAGWRRSPPRRPASSALRLPRHCRPRAGPAPSRRCARRAPGAARAPGSGRRAGASSPGAQALRPPNVSPAVVAA